ncbi:MAG: tetratricopeptide repeat protein [Desulfobacterales bacterium]|nr:tetratricopeptide repeat protein [Desulfobacterales bacterium]
MGYFFRAFFWSFPFLALLGLLIAGVTGLIVAAIVSIIASTITVCISDRLGGAVSKTLFGMHKREWSLREQLSGALNQAMLHKSQKRYDQALRTVNGVLDKDPDFPDALFLKAQILLEGFGNTEAAKGYLKKVMEAVPNNRAAIHRSASRLYHELTGTEAND